LNSFADPFGYNKEWFAAPGIDGYAVSLHDFPGVDRLGAPAAEFADEPPVSVEA